MNTRPSPLRANRLLRGLRLRDVERETGIPDTTLSRLERGDLPLSGDWLATLAGFYGIEARGLEAEMEAWPDGSEVHQR